MKEQVVPLTLGSASRIMSDGKTSGTPPTLVLTTNNLEPQILVSYMNYRYKYHNTSQIIDRNNDSCYSPVVTRVLPVIYTDYLQLIVIIGVGLGGKRECQLGIFKNTSKDTKSHLKKGVAQRIFKSRTDASQQHKTKKSVEIGVGYFSFLKTLNIPIRREQMRE